MRINFAGSLLKLNPLVLVYEANDTFVKAAYVSAGYRNYEAIAIGAGGGRGGNYFGADWMDDSRTIHCYGGMGGGGGFHRIRGVLSALPSSVNVVIGGPGAQEESAFTPPPFPSTHIRTEATAGLEPPRQLEGEVSVVSHKS
jgi:hypothetical protein